MQVSESAELADVARVLASASRASGRDPVSVLVSAGAGKALDAAAAQCVASGLQWKPVPATVRKAAAVNLQVLAGDVAKLQTDVRRVSQEAGACAAESTAGVEWQSFSRSVGQAATDAQAACAALGRRCDNASAVLQGLASRAGVPPDAVLVAFRKFSDDFDASWAKAKRSAAVAARQPPVAAAAPAPSAPPAPPTIQDLLKQKFVVPYEAPDDDDDRDW